MSSSILALASLVSAALVGPGPADRPAADAAQVACGARPGPITGELVRARLHDLLRSEGLPSVTGIVDVAVRPAELDGDARTDEALVDLIVPALCLTGGCPTIVVQQGMDGEVSTLGRGTGLYTIATRTSGWSDLSETGLLPLTPRRTLRFVRGRYQ